MSIRTHSDPVTPHTAATPEEQGHPVAEVYEALADGKRVATVSLTLDGQTWIAGMNDSEADSHLGSFSSFEEAKSAVASRLHPGSTPIEWIRLTRP